MTAQEYTEEYNKAGQEKNLHESDGWDDLDDDNFSPKSLLKYMEENPELLPALLFFKLSPGSLAEFIGAKGGAEMYE